MSMSEAKCECRIEYEGGGMPQIVKCALCKAAPELYDALVKLNNEVSGVIGHYEPMLSEMIGNTNAKVLHDRVVEARAIITKAKSR